jgi:HSP20 family protein
MAHFPQRSPFFGIFDELLQGPFNGVLGSDSIDRRPRVNVVETAENFRLEMAAPGLAKEDINIKLEEDQLSISVEKTVENVEGETYRRREFDYAQFTKRFTLPDTIDTGKISAAFDKGILVLHLPKRAEAKPEPAKTIEIK